MSALPRAVQQQLDEADRIQQQVVAPPPPAVEPPATPVEPPQPQTAVSTPPEPQPAPPPAEPSQDSAYWKARFDTMQGKYNAEVPRLTHALHETQQGLAQLRGQLEGMRQQPAPAAPQPAALVTDKDDEKFGADLVDLMRRVAREERRPVEQSLGRIDQQIQQVTPQLARVQQMERQVVGSREEHFYATLAAQVPDWETVNADPRWLGWLKEYDPVAGKTRQASLDEASAAIDARRAVALFKLFKGTLPAQPTPQSQAQAELARQVAPSRSATTTVAPQGEKTFTGAEYAHWTDYRRIHDTSKDVLERMLAEVEKALADGRVKF